MNITISDTNITLQTEDASSSCVLLTKPDIADYGNVTIRPLVKTYHLLRETIWERFGQCVQELEKHCREDMHCNCYLMAFSALYAPLLSNSQAKNIFCYGQDAATPFIALLQDFMTFLQADSSLVPLPPNPFVFSGLANASYHAAIINLDTCSDLQTICDAITKVRKNGTVLLYTAGIAQTGDIEGLLSNAAKTVFASCTLYVLTVDTAFGELIYSYSAEALVLTRTEEIFTQTARLKALIEQIEQECFQPEDCLNAIELLCRMEEILFASYDYLENPGLPAKANLLKEAVMDCYSEPDDLQSNQSIQVYQEKLHLAALDFYAAIETEFQC